jgi:hypothetical protein
MEEQNDKNSLTCAIILYMDQKLESNPPTTPHIKIGLNEMTVILGGRSVHLYCTETNC